MSRVALAITSLAILLIAWHLLASSGSISSSYLPDPRQVLSRAMQLYGDGFMGFSIAAHVFTSIARVLIALYIAIFLGIPMGFLMGRFHIMAGLFEPILDFIRPLPPLAYLPLLVIWFGIGEASKILLIFLAILFPIVVSTARAIPLVPQTMINAAKSLGAKERDVLREIYVPFALPHILTGVRIGLAAGWSTLVAAELVAATKGIGFVIQSAASFAQTDVVIYGVIVIGLVAISMELVLKAIQNNLSPWEKFMPA